MTPRERKIDDRRTREELRAVIIATVWVLAGSGMFALIGYWLTNGAGVK